MKRRTHYCCVGLLLLGIAGTTHGQSSGATELMQRYRQAQAEQRRMAVDTQLLALGSTAIPELFQAFALRRMPGLESPQLNQEETDILANALLNQAGSLLPDFLLHVAQEGTYRERGRALELLAQDGSRSYLETAFQLVAFSKEQPVVPELVRTFSDYAEVLAYSDPLALEYMLGSLPSAPEELRLPIFEQVCKGPRPDALSALSLNLGRYQGLDDYLLLSIAQLGAPRNEALDLIVSSSVRDYLRYQPDATLRAACRAAGALDDSDAVEALIKLLRHQNPQVQLAANEALVRIGDRQLHGDPEAWELWHRRETAWWKVESRSTFAKLHHTDSATAAQAAVEISKHRLHRRQLALELERGLEYREPELTIHILGVLGQIASPHSSKKLLQMMEHSNEQVAQAARDCLARIMGRTTPRRSAVATRP